MNVFRCLRGFAGWSGVGPRRAVRPPAVLLLAGLGLSLASGFGAGRQLTGVYAPTPTAPLPPEEAAAKMTLPEGFEARIFAYEPQVVNPVAMTWDERGRLWVVELYEYPLGAPEGATPRDKVKILEDTDGDGRADKVTIFAEGLNLATGVLVGYGGAFVGQAPHLYFMEDTDGDDRADKKTIVMTGFGLEDRHELLNGFTWGPDGHLYMTHGVFTRSMVKNPDDPDDDGVLMTAAVARFHPKTRKFEIFAEGTSNPWGVDFDRYGNAFVSACVIDHLFHMSPGGLYQRQAGSAPNPFAYENLPSIVDHKHFRAAYAGAQIYQGDQYPEEYRGTVLMGNIHDSAVHQDRLTPAGASFKASFVRDFVRANDGWFRPVSTQVGPDGAVWIMDWYDKYPCYQNANADPEGVDRTHGRIWRIVYTGGQKGKPVPPRPAGLDLKKATPEELVQTLAHPNVWHRRMAQQILTERGESSFPKSLHRGTPLHKMLTEGPTLEARLAALWTLHGAGLIDEFNLDKAAEDKEPAIRAWVARITGERNYPLGDAMDRLEKLARDPDITVRTAVAVAARQFISGSLTVNTPPKIPVREVITGGVLSALWFATEGKHDPLFTFTYWMAAEPVIALDPLHALGFYQQDGAVNALPFSGIVLSKIMRRVCDLGDVEMLSQGLLTLSKLGEAHAPAIAAALRGVLEGQRGKPVAPSAEARALVARWATLQDPAASGAARQLGTSWGEASAIEGSLRLARDKTKSDEERVQAIQAVRQQKLSSVRSALLELVTSDAPAAVSSAALQALSEAGLDETGEEILSRWKALPAGLRSTAASVLTARRRWAQSFLTAIEGRRVQIGELPAPVVRSLLNSKDEEVRKRAAAVIGKFRESNPDKVQLIAEKKRAVLTGVPDLKRGHEIAQRTCFNCHKMHGEGAEVGPDLTGVGRSSLEALLANVIDPNQLIGSGYENVEIETKDGRIVSGRMVENNDSRVRLVAAGPKEEVVAKGDIASMRVSEMSVMPEGLEQMPDADFRDLAWYILNPPQDRKALQLEVREKQLVVHANPGQPNARELATYVIDPNLRPYLHPVRDGSGTVTLTQDRPSDHVWQHGIFTGLHGVNGVDFWTERQGRQRFVRLLDVQQEQDYAGWSSLTEWVAPDGSVTLDEIQTIKFYVPSATGQYHIDFDWTLRARDRTVRIGRHDYGGLAVRLEYDAAHTHLNSNGERAKDTSEKRAAWCNVSRSFGGQTFGVAVLDHPSNFGFPAAWRVDGQGLINPSPSLQGDWSIEAAKDRTFHYRLVVHPGAGDAVALDRAFKEYSALRFGNIASVLQDGESVALWNPQWRINTGQQDGMPNRLPDYLGRRNVLVTHPFEASKPATLERTVAVAGGGITTLAFNVAAHDRGDWELRVYAGTKLVKQELIKPEGERWKRYAVDLSEFAGQSVPVRLENRANDWAYEFGYWQDLRVETGASTTGGR